MALAFPKFDFVSYTHYFFPFFVMHQLIDARRGAPWDATCEKSVTLSSRVAGDGPQSESIRHYLDKECLEKNICAVWLY